MASNPVAKTMTSKGMSSAVVRTPVPVIVSIGVSRRSTSLTLSRLKVS